MVLLRQFHVFRLKTRILGEAGGQETVTVVAIAIVTVVVDVVVASMISGTTAVPLGTAAHRHARLASGRRGAPPT